MVEEAQSAAKASLGLNIEQLFRDGTCGYLPFYFYKNLTIYKEACVNDACELVRDLTWVRGATRQERNYWRPSFLSCTTCRDASGKAKWFSEYLSVVEDKLRKDPRSKTITPWENVGQAFAETRGCSNCKTRAADDLQRFNNLLSQKVRETLSEVSRPFFCQYS